ncbi:MAG: hypothetical protein JWQ61_890 [Collimonas fungivorans]|uniref:DUF1579 family protein n=1 Tax=Collimonas fungivorans TaxID=158899 RepID=UPI0026ECA37B|nr:DUF1579 family protein [Collimonas fungivorans]MDB5766076.1 hypothetical protein [Collimonas fungivorans]
MALIPRVARILSTAATYSIFCIGMFSTAHAQNAPKKISDPTLIQQMAGTWNVQQRMWPGVGAEAVNLPPAAARRRLMAGGFLEEVMEPVQKTGEGSFTRTAFFNYNAVNQQYEYFSLDSRAPQMMNERSDKTEEQIHPGKDGIKLSGGNFVAPQWGAVKDAAFTYRLTVGEIKKDRQVVQLYLTPQGGESPKEFLAFEYIYTRRR